MARMVKRSRAFHTGNPFQRASAPQQPQPPSASKRCQRILEAALTNLSATERKHHLWRAVHLLRKRFVAGFRGPVRRVLSGCVVAVVESS